MKIILPLLLFLGLLVISETYSTKLALELGYMAEIAYEDTAKVEAWTCSYCSKYHIEGPRVFYHSLSGTKGFTGYSKSLNAAIVSFRGSSNVQNWVINLSTTRSNYPGCDGCSAHSGFLTAYNAVQATIRSEITRLTSMYRGCKIMVTGHSLGGAMAILAAADIKLTFHRVDEVYTFGQPRVGNAAFAKWFETQIPQTYRLVHNADIVPHVPPSNFGFQHSSTQYWYAADMQTYKTCSAQSPDCANSVSVTAYSIGDHSMDNYIKLKAFQLQREFFSILDIFAKFTIGGGKDDGNDSWKDQEERKVQALIQRLKSRQTQTNQLIHQQ